MKRITLGHGAGGTLTSDLVRQVFLHHFMNPYLEALSDSAVLPPGDGDSATSLAVTTDAFVVTPIFFPGGDIGELAVFGTVNDLAVAGARPAYLTASFIIEEGFAYADLDRVAASMARAARRAGVQVVAGDTKVVERGSCDGLFIVTSGVGRLIPGVSLSSARVLPGDCLVINGAVGQHGAAIMCARQGEDFGTSIRSDCSPLAGVLETLLVELGEGIKWLRDPTRGGLATTVVELAESAGQCVVLEEEAVPIPDDVCGACEMLGLDPLYLANEGKVLIVAAPEATPRLLALLSEAGQHQAAVVGQVATSQGMMGSWGAGAYLRTRLGGTKTLDRLTGHQMPRIC